MRGALVVLGHASAGFEGDAEGQTAPKLVSIAGTLVEVSGQRVVLRHSRTRRMKLPKAKAAVRDVGGTGTLEKIGGLIVILCYAIPGCVECAEVGASREVGTVTRPLKERDSAREIRWD